MNAKFENIDDYIKSHEKSVQETLTEIRKIIKIAAPNAEELISYQMPAFKQNGFLVYFAAFKNHIGFYPTASGISAFKERISKYKNAKGSVQFPLNAPIPFDLIEEIVKYRVDENLKK